MVPWPILYVLMKVGGLKYWNLYWGRILNGRVFLRCLVSITLHTALGIYVLRNVRICYLVQSLDSYIQVTKCNRRNFCLSRFYIYHPSSAHIFSMKHFWSFQLCFYTYVACQLLGVVILNLICMSSWSTNHWTALFLMFSPYRHILCRLQSRIICKGSHLISIV